MPYHPYHYQQVMDLALLRKNDPFDDLDEDRFETESIGLVRDFEKNDAKLYPLLFLVPLGIIAYLVLKK
tara:strand:- start:817 stop:1023 length:207 start_codon:yes stop_codon:yes gene_type:complete